MDQCETIFEIDVHVRKRIRIILLVLMSIAAGALVIFSGNLAFDFYSNHNEIETKAINSTMADSRRIDTLIRRIEKNVRDITALVGEKDFNENQLIDLLYHRNSDNPCHYSINFFFDKDSSAVKGKMEDPGVRRIFDMLNVKVFTSAIPLHEMNIDTKRNGWKKAFWSKADQSIMVTYQNLLYGSNDSGKKVPIGIVSARVSIEEMRMALEKHDLGSYGYHFIVDGEGNLLFHPNIERVINNFNLLDYARKNYTHKSSNRLLDAFRDKIPVTIMENNIISGQPALIRLEPIPATGWYTGIVLIVDEFSITNTQIKQHLMRALTALVVLLTITCIYLLLYSTPCSTIREHTIKRYSWIVTFIIMGGLIGIWFLQVTKSGQSPYSDKCITSMMQVEEFKREQLEKSKRQLTAPPQFIQTGILIRSALPSESKETLELYGLAWQRIPDGLDVDRTAGIRFPDEIETRFKETYRIRQDGYTVIGWNFFTRIREDFRTRIYPFDRLTLDLRMRQMNDFSSIVLVPDLESYTIITPSSKSLVADNLSIPGWHLDNTYYNLFEHSYNIDYGLHKTKREHYLKDLGLVISIRRDWVGSFVSVLIPVFVILTILYSGIYMITTTVDTRQIFNFDEVSITNIGASFVLFIVLSIQGVRQRVIADGILYVELIYFLIYFAILANITIAITVTEKREKFVNYENGKLIRYIFWPFYIGLLYVITLISFY